jgi:hypothetical protein
VTEAVQHRTLLGKHQQQRQHPRQGQPTHMACEHLKDRTAGKSSDPCGSFLAVVAAFAVKRQPNCDGRNMGPKAQLKG